MSDQNTGGGGSVRWRVVADDVRPGDSECKDEGGKLHQHGKDKSANVGEWFTISIAVPDGDNVSDYLNFLKANLKEDSHGPGARVYFNLKIEDNPDQIRVSWGASDNLNNPITFRTT